MMKEELEDIFGSIELDYNVNVTVGEFSAFFKVQIIPSNLDMDIESLYDSIMESVERSESIDGLSLLESEIIWIYSGEKSDKYIIRSKEDIPKTKVRAQEYLDSKAYLFEESRNRGVKFGGFIFYLHASKNTQKMESIKDWNEFNLIKESQEEWDNVIEIVNEILDDIDSEYKLLYSQIHKNRLSDDNITHIKLTLILDPSENLLEFNKYLISQIEWVMEKEEVVVDEVYITLNNELIPSKLMKYRSSGAGMKLTNKNGDMINNLKLLINNVYSWRIFFYKSDHVSWSGYKHNGTI